MGNLFKSKTTTTKSPFETNPWEPQQDYLASGFNTARNYLEWGLNGINRVNDTVADLTPQQQQLIAQGIGNYGQLTNAGMGMVGQGNNATNSAIAGMQGAAGKVGSTASQIAGVANAGSQAINSAAGDALQSGLASSQALSNQANQGVELGTQGANQIGQQANSLFNGGSIGGIIGDAGQVANNPYLNQQIDSAIADVQRGFQGTQAEINSAASGAGGMNSTRAGLLESKALESAQRTAADISTGMRSDAYNTGLQTSLQNKNLNNSILNTQLGANGQAADIRNSGFANQLASQAFGQDARNNNIAHLMGSTGLQMDGLNAAMNGYNSQAGILQGAGQLGQQMTSNGANIANMGMQNGFDLASVRQQQQQNEIDGALNKSTMGLDLVSQYMQAIGGNYGQQGYTSQVSKSASPFQQIVGGASSLIGAFG